MRSRWALIVADFRREYHCSSVELGAMSVPEFMLLLQGLSKNSRFMRAWHDAPKNLYDATEIQAVTAALRR